MDFGTDGGEFDFDLPAISDDDSVSYDDFSWDVASHEDLHMPLSPGPTWPCAAVSPSWLADYGGSVILPSSSAAYINKSTLQCDHTNVHELVSSDSMFVGLSWSRMKYQYERTTSGGVVRERPRRFDYQSYRLLNGMCQFYVLDSASGTNTREFAHQPVIARSISQSFANGRHTGLHVKRDDNCDQHMIPPMCCDPQKRSLMWMPIDINVRPTSGIGRGQPIFADFIEPRPYTVRMHPIWRYQSFLHGINHNDIYKPVRGYYPLRSDLAACPDKHARARMLSQREPLTVVDGFEILKKLAGVDPNSWTNVMAFLPFNEKCSWAQYLSAETCERVYGVHYPHARTLPLPIKRPQMFSFSGNMLGGLDSLSARMQEVAVIRHMRYHARKMKPFDQLWHLKTTYDLSNFCNRHNARSRALSTISANIIDCVVPTIEEICRRLTVLGVTRVQIDGSKEQAHLAARHTVDHNNYMQAWRDLSALTSLAMFDEEPSQAEVARCFAMWGRHSALCRAHGVTPKFHVPFLHAQWHVRRLHSFVGIIYRYMGKNYNDLLKVVYDSDCALRADVTCESAKGRTTILDLLSNQISTSIDIDMKRLYGQCVRFNYQEMDCNSCSRSEDNPYACSNGGMCYGCDCHPVAKSSTADDVERMFTHLDKFQATFNLDYGSEQNFPSVSYTSSTLQYAHHQHRKRFAVAVTPVMTNTDLTTIPGIESLLVGDLTQSAPTPMAYDFFRIPEFL